jgi:large subunit ribosomal protein L24
MPVIRKGDTVKVIAGKEKGKSGVVLEVLREEGRVRIEKLMTVKRHVRKGRNQANPEGGIVEKAGTIAISNVMVVRASSAPRKRPASPSARRPPSSSEVQRIARH